MFGQAILAFSAFYICIANLTIERKPGIENMSSSSIYFCSLNSYLMSFESKVTVFFFFLILKIYSGSIDKNLHSGDFTYS